MIEVTRYTRRVARRILTGALNEKHGHEGRKVFLTDADKAEMHGIINNAVAHTLSGSNTDEAVSAHLEGAKQNLATYFCEGLSRFPTGLQPPGKLAKLAEQYKSDAEGIANQVINQIKGLRTPKGLNATAGELMDGGVRGWIRRHITQSSKSLHTPHR